MAGHTLRRQSITQLEQGAVAMLAEPSHNQISVSFRLAGIAVTSEGTGTNIPFLNLQGAPTADARHTALQPLDAMHQPTRQQEHGYEDQQKGPLTYLPTSIGR